MIAVPITHYLERKSRESAGISSEPTPLDIQAATEAWYAKGFKEGSAQAKSACDAALAHREVECKLWIDAARKSWSETEGAALGMQITHAASAVKADIADTVARILRPLVAQKLAAEALAKLASEIEDLLSHDDAIHFKVSGPADLVFGLRKRIPPNAIVTVEAGDKPEVRVFANKTVIETRLTEWLTRIGVYGLAQEPEPQGP